MQSQLQSPVVQSPRSQTEQSTQVVPQVESQDVSQVPQVSQAQEGGQDKSLLEEYMENIGLLPTEVLEGVLLMCKMLCLHIIYFFGFVVWPKDNYR